MFARAEDRVITAQQRYKIYSVRHRGNYPAIDIGPEVFVERPKTELKTVQEKEEQEVKSKLLPKSDGPFKFVQSFENVVVICDNDVNVPVSIDRCTPAPPIRSPPANPNMNTTTTSLQKTPTPALNDTNDHPDVTPTYNVQMADATRPRHIARAFVPAALLASYWMHLVRPPKNPHMRKRGRPRKADSAHPANRALIDARYYNFK